MFWLILNTINAFRMVSRRKAREMKKNAVAKSLDCLY